MKLFHKNAKKKPITDKAKEERKQKTKHIIKIILDILMYGFAILMAFALAVGGACSPKTKTASAYYHSDVGYTSINAINVNSDTALHYYYDYNYSKTFPDFGTITDVLSIANNFLAYVEFENPIVVDNVTYPYLALEHNYNSIIQSRTMVLTIIDSTAYNRRYISVVNFSTSAIRIVRSDLLTTIFSGTNRVHVSTHNDINDNFYRWLVWHFGELGYNRITYSFPVTIEQFSYLFVNSNTTAPSLNFGTLFTNDTFPVINVNEEGSTYIISMFTGSFRCNGVYYSNIQFRFSSVYGYAYLDSAGVPIFYNYSFPGSLDTINSNDEAYLQYWYLDSIVYSGYGNSTTAWLSGSRNGYIGTSGDNPFKVKYEFNYTWVGDSYNNVSPFRDLYIFYVDDSTRNDSIRYPYRDSFIQLYDFNFANFLNYIGEAYPSPFGGRPSNTGSPIFASVFEWLRSALSGAMPMFSYTLLPGITIGTLVMVPVVMSILLLLIKLFKR